MVKKFNILLLSILLTACESSIDEPHEQRDFKSLITSLSKEYESSQNSGNELVIKNFEKKFESELKGKNRPVSAWVGKFVSSDLHGEELTIELSNDNQIYHLVLVDPKTIEYSKQFKKDDLILFSGNIGPESSLTINGALREPEFRFYPTKISTRDDKEGVIQNQKIIDDLQKKKAMEERAFLIKKAIEIQCKDLIVTNLRFPESADFSSNEKITKLDNNKFIYNGVVISKNGFGNEVPSRFRCVAQVDDKDDPTIQVLKIELIDK